MRSVWFGGSNSAPSNAAVNFHGLTGAFSGGWNATNTNRQVPCSEAVTIKKFTVWSDTAVATGTYVFAVDIAGSASAAAVTLTGGATTGTFTGSVAVAQDALLSIRETPTTTPTTLTNIYWVIEYETAGSFFVLIGGSSTTFSASVNNFAMPVGFNGSAHGTTEANRSILAPDGGTISRISVAVPPGTPSPGTYAISLRKNATTDLLTATIASGVTAAQASGSAAIAAGDSLTIKIVPASTPTVRRGGWSCTINPTSRRGTWHGEGGDNGASGLFADNTTRYEQPDGLGSNGISTTENTRFLKLPGFLLRNLYFSIATAPGGTATRTLTVRDNSANTVLACTVASGATTANDTLDMYRLSSGTNPFGLQFSAANTPANAATWSVGFIIDVDQSTDPPPQQGGKALHQKPWLMRRRFFAIPPLPPAPAPTQGGKSVRQKPWPRRGKFFSGPFATPVAAAPSVPPMFGGKAIRQKPWMRRGKFFWAPFTGLSLEQTPVPDRIVPANRRRSFMLARRGKFQFFAPFTALSLEQAVVPDFNGRPTNRLPRPTRRGHTFSPPWVGLAPGQFVVPDRILARRDRRIGPAAAIRRGSGRKLHDYMAPGTHGFTLALWNLTLPTADTGSSPLAHVISNTLLQTYADGQFHFDSQGRMAFIAPVQGATTGGSDGARSELRELEANGTNSSWAMATASRRLRWSGQYDPTNTGDRLEEIIGQIHGSSGTPPLYLSWEDNSGAPRVRVFMNGPGIGNILTGLTTGQLVSFELLVTGGRVYLKACTGAQSGLDSTPTWNSWAYSDFTDNSACYFKVGTYNKSLSGGVGQGWCESRLSFLSLDQNVPGIVLDPIQSRYARTFTLARRGRVFQFPFPVVVPPGSQAKPPDWIVPANRRRTFALARRGRIAFFPLVGSGTGYQTAWIPPVPSRRQSLVFALARRGRFFPFQVTPTQQPVVPQFIRQTRRVPAIRARGGEFQPTPIVDRSVVTFRTRRRAQGVTVLQRRRFQPVPLGAPTVPQRNVASRVRVRGLRARHGSYQALPPTAARQAVNGGFFQFFG